MGSVFGTRSLIGLMNFLMWFGNTTIMLMAAIMGISVEVFEACEIDGCNSLQRFFYITLPMILSLIHILTSLLHRICTTAYGVEVTPAMSFDERGHQKNHTTYFVYGSTGEGEAPAAFYPTVGEFIGEGGSYPVSYTHLDVYKRQCLNCC